MTSGTETVNVQEGKLFVKPYCGPAICSLMTEVGQKLFLSLSAASTAVQLQLEEVTKASIAQMFISCGDFSHYESMTVKTQVSTVFFVTQLNSEIKVGRDIGHEKVIMQHRAAVMEGLGRDQGNWKP